MTRLYSKKNILICCLMLSSISLFSQLTVGTLLNEESSLQGYTFFSPFNSTKAYLVDNCGHLVNEWARGTKPGLAAYFLENGLMLRTYKPSVVGPFTSASNSGGLELVDWDNNTVWSYEFNTSTWLSHHDAVYMPNGNMLVLTWELVYTDELIELGRDPNEIAVEGYMWSERIIEVQPFGTSDMNIVWEWRIKDHYIQDFDPSKQNYGVIADHPELFNINLPELNSSNSNSTRDWNHFNAIDYNPELDQILISVRNSDEIWIIDHSTTTAEAASHSGGKYGKGGDLLYRWGNASAYERAPVSDQKLFGQHGVHWIREGQDAGKIFIFNNGNGRPGPDYSTGEILSPPQDSTGGYILPSSDPFGPDDAEIIYGDQAGESFYSPYLSNPQRLANGNSLLNFGSPGRIMEIDPQRNVVWEYEIPLNGDFPYSQGQNPNNNATFRAYKYPADYPGFEGLDLTAGSTLHLDSDPADCMLFSDVNKIDSSLEIVFNYGLGIYFFEIYNPNTFDLTISVFDVSGRKSFSKRTQSIEEKIDIHFLNQGIYFVQVLDDIGRTSIWKILR